MKIFANWKILVEEECVRFNRPIRRPTVCKVFRVAVEDIVLDTGPIQERFHPEGVASSPLQVAFQRKLCSPSRSWYSSRSNSSWSPEEERWRTTVDDAHGESFEGGRAIAASVDLSRRGPPWWPSSGQLRLRIPPNPPRDNPSPISYCRTLQGLQNYTKIIAYHRFRIWLIFTSRVPI